jgi:hypothetical protein
MVTIGAGGGRSVRTAPPGGGGHTLYRVSGEIWPASLAPVCDARVSMGRPLGPIQIRAVYLYVGLGGDADTGMTLTVSLSSSSSVTATSTTSSAVVTPSSPSLGLGDDNTELLSATG